MKRLLAFMVGFLLTGCVPRPSVTAPASRPAPAQPGELGVASWYGPGFEGKLMASKQRFSSDLMVAAHRTLRIGAAIRVKNRRNGAEVILTVLDRGPYVKGRILDVSLAAAQKLGFEEEGLTDVEITVIEEVA